MTCKEAVEKLHDYLDNELDHASTGQIKKHLDICRRCCDQLEFEKTMKELVQGCCTQSKAPSILREKIKKSLEL
jgi:mycothiol system anti-sigma-R factor